jgi:uridine phosphorylase
VTSTGIGGPSATIAVEELVAIGADTFIRVGTSGGMQPGTIPGEIAVVTAAIRDEGTSLHYLPVEFPAVADTDVVLAMIEGAKRAGMPYRVGISQTKDSYYGEVEPERMPVANQLIERWDAWVAGGAICSEMESSAIFIVSSIHHVRAGGVMLMSFSEDSTPQTEEEWQRFEEMFNIERVIQTAIEGLKVLIERDSKK